MVFQNPDNQIIGTSVEEDVALVRKTKNIEPEKIKKNCRNCFAKSEAVGSEKGVTFHIIRRTKTETGNADALAGLPACLVLDEPTAMLDPDSRKEVINIVKEIESKRRNDDYSDYASHG